MQKLRNYETCVGNGRWGYATKNRKYKDFIVTDFSFMQDKIRVEFYYDWYERKRFVVSVVFNNGIDVKVETLPYNVNDRVVKIAVNYLMQWINAVFRDGSKISDLIDDFGDFSVDEKGYAIIGKMAMDNLKRSYQSTYNPFCYAMYEMLNKHKGVYHIIAMKNLGEKVVSYTKMSKGL